MADSSFSKFLSNVIFPTYHFALGSGLLKIIKEYKKSQMYPIDTLHSLQMDKLQWLLIHCERNVPYYKNLFKQLNFSSKKLIEYDNFVNIPILTKEFINKNRENFIALNMKKKNLVSNSTSGSTGENLYFYQDKNAMLNRQAVVWRNQEWVDCLYADRQASLWGAPLDLTKSNSLLGRTHSFFTRHLSLSSYELSDVSMMQYAKRLNKHRPKLLISYPTPLTTFAEFMLKSNIEIPSIKSIITSAETLYSWQRSIIEDAFKCPVYDRYGCREFGNIAHECNQHEGYHINIERFFLEILNENGEPTQPGEMGEVIITDLDNYGFPFLRYRIEDMAVPSNKSCSCGRSLPIIQQIKGRSFDIIKTPNGNRIAGTFWTLALRAVPGIDSFQVEQPSLNKLIVKIVPATSFSKNSEQQILNTIKGKCGNEMEIEFVYVDKIPLTKSGKMRFVISMIDGIDG